MRKAILLVQVTILLLLCSCGLKHSISELPTQSVSDLSEEAISNEPEILDSYGEPIHTEDKWAERWRDTRDYPLKIGDPEWDAVSFPDKKELLNPPDDVLNSLSKEELAKLFLTYPLFPYMPSIDEYRTGFMDIYQEYSTIAERFMQYEDRFDYLMHVYKENELQVERAEDYSGFFDESFWVDIVTQKYVLAYGETLTEEEKNLYKEIYSEREEKYYSKIDRNNWAWFYPINFNEFEPKLMLPYTEVKALTCTVTSLPESDAVSFSCEEANIDGLWIKMTNNTGKDIVYGRRFSLERRENGEWKSVDIPIGSENKTFTDEGIMLKETGILYLHWSDIYDMPYEGEYRLILPSMTYWGDNPQTAVEKPVVEFVIE